MMENRGEESLIRRGRGRPKKEETLNIQLKGWIGQNEKDMIEHMLIESDRSKSELLRRMIRTYYYTYNGKW